MTRGHKRLRWVGIALAITSCAAILSGANLASDPTQTKGTDADELRALLVAQQKQIEELRSELAEQKKVIEKLGPANSDARFSIPDAKKLGEVATTSPVLPPAPAPSLNAAPAGDNAVDVNALSKRLDKLASQWGGFKIGGDLRLRFDSTTRSGNSVGGPAQNVRERYRFRLFVDKSFFYKDGGETPLVTLHATLATGPLNNPLTLDNDFAASAGRGFVSLWEAYAQVNASKIFSFRVGRVNEPFEDGSQFLIDPDLRFNGANETFHFGGKKGFFDIRAAQLVLSNPNVQVLASSNAYATAGFPVGAKVPAAALFDQGVVIGGGPKDFTQNLALGFQIYRNPNEIQLYSTANGVGLINGAWGVTLSGPLSGTGNATTTAGGPIYFAKDFHILHLDYKSTFGKPKLGSRAFPVSLEAHFAHNAGSGIENNAWAGGIKAGQTKKFGEIMLGYVYFHKEANSMVSQYTDDDVGTGSGVNIRAHQFLFDVGLTKYLSWQNRIYVLDPLAKSDTAINFFVPVQAGVNTQFRFQSQFLFTF